MPNRVLVTLALSLLIGCFPALPSHFAESTDVLDPGIAGVTMAGGVAGLAQDCCQSQSSGRVAGGGELRARVGVGAKQEVGASLFAGLGDGKPIPYAVGGKASYKIAPISWLAVVAGAGAMAVVDQPTTPVFGGDAAVVAAPYTDAHGTQIYTGARGSFAIPTLEGAHGATEALTVPLGFALRSNQAVRYFVELGAIVARSQYRDEKDATIGGDITTLGGYTTIAASFVLR